MKFKAKETINLRSGPSVESSKVGSIVSGTILESDEYTWKAVTLPDGTKGFCAANYLEAVVDNPLTKKWFEPIRTDKFKLTQRFLEPNPLYKITGHHPGADYGTQGQDNVPLYFCADGEVIESNYSASLGNYFFYYVAEVDRTFAYFHLRDKAPKKGQYRGGEVCGITGQTGLSQGIHLHLECIKGKKTSAERIAVYTSVENIKKAAEDADAFIRARL